MYLFLIKDAKLFNKNIMNFGKKFSDIMIKKFNGKTCMLWKISKNKIAIKKKLTQTFTIKKNNKTKLFTDDIDIFSYDSDREISNYSDEKKF